MQKLTVWCYLDKLFSNLKEQEPVDGIEHLQEIVLDQLQNGICIFYFTKSDGEVRKAVGTLKPELLPNKTGITESMALGVMACLVRSNQYIIEARKPKEERDKNIIAKYKEQEDKINETAENSYLVMLKAGEEGKEKTKSTTSQAFYDLQAMAWKSYNTNNLIGCIEL